MKTKIFARQKVKNELKRKAHLFIRPVGVDLISFSKNRVIFHRIQTQGRLKCRSLRRKVKELRSKGLPIELWVWEQGSKYWFYKVVA